MNLTDLRDELADQASEMDNYDTDLLPGARRRARAIKGRRQAAVSAGVAVAVGAVAIMTGLPSDTVPPEPRSPVATGTTSQPAPPRAIAERQRVELSDGVWFSYDGPSWTWQLPKANGEVFQAAYDLTQWGPMQIRVENLPGDRLHSMDVFRGSAVRVVYTVQIPGRSAAMYQADLYRISAHPGWTLSYAVYPARGFTDARQVKVTATGYDAAGKPIPIRPRQ